MTKEMVLSIIGLVVIVVLAVLTGGVILVPAFPFIIVMLQKLGVVPK